MRKFLFAVVATVTMCAVAEAQPSKLPGQRYPNPGTSFQSSGRGTYLQPYPNVGTYRYNVPGHNNNSQAFGYTNPYGNKTPIVQPPQLAVPRVPSVDPGPFQWSTGNVGSGAGGRTHAPPTPYNPFKK